MKQTDTDTASHTPGPWVAEGADIYAPAPANVRPYIAHCVYGPREARANARLIAAAPDLLAEVREAGYDFAALSSIVSAIITWQDDLPLPVRQKLTHAANIIERRYEPSRAAIAKATGQA